MRYLELFYSALLAATFCDSTSALRSAPKVKLSNVQSLTLRKGLQTSHRRVSSIPQLKCIGGSAKGLYDIDVLRCKNAGSDYDEEAIQWTCSASLPEEFKLGSTDVICEGYDYPDDPYILKGSCGVEYRLVLTEKGEQKYGKKKGGWWGGDDDDYDRGRDDHETTMGDRIVGAVFWMIFIGVALWIVYNAFQGWANGPAAGGVGGGNRPGWGGGGGGGWGGHDDPPPPYDWNPDSRSNPYNKRSYGATEGWRPGFWSGALGGAAAGYAAGNWANNRQQNNTGSRWGGGGGSWDNGEGSSRSSSGSSSYSSTRHESTGFGSTSRR
ncbi:DUF1183-domain-containing protein [Periconia macrospinosa]|uniref:Store-operated calcium entry-associated regulatory factor n=1 Tax=Periconia macrospinosa TaxID=97972 RepID=A0A2V1EBU0_9PLEO|nr:DUF1183-domain-containing protein [Periconia macrospinosa]